MTTHIDTFHNQYPPIGAQQQQQQHLHHQQHHHNMSLVGNNNPMESLSETSREWLALTPEGTCKRHPNVPLVFPHRLVACKICQSESEAGETSRQRRSFAFCVQQVQRFHQDTKQWNQFKENWIEEVDEEEEEEEDDDEGGEGEAEESSSEREMERKMLSEEKKTSSGAEGGGAVASIMSSFPAAKGKCQGQYWIETLWERLHQVQQWKVREKEKQLRQANQEKNDAVQALKALLQDKDKEIEALRKQLHDKESQMKYLGTTIKTHEKTIKEDLRMIKQIAMERQKRRLRSISRSNSTSPKPKRPSDILNAQKTQENTHTTKSAVPKPTNEAQVPKPSSEAQEPKPAEKREETNDDKINVHRHPSSPTDKKGTAGKDDHGVPPETATSSPKSLSSREQNNPSPRADGHVQQEQPYSPEKSPLSGRKSHGSSPNAVKKKMPAGHIQREQPHSPEKSPLSGRKSHGSSPNAVKKKMPAASPKVSPVSTKKDSDEEDEDRDYPTAIEANPPPIRHVALSAPVREASEVTWHGGFVESQRISSRVAAGQLSQLSLQEGEEEEEEEEISEPPPVTTIIPNGNGNTIAADETSEVTWLSVYTPRKASDVRRSAPSFAQTVQEDVVFTPQQDEPVGSLDVTDHNPSVILKRHHSTPANHKQPPKTQVAKRPSASSAPGFRESTAIHKIEEDVVFVPTQSEVTHITNEISCSKSKRSGDGKPARKQCQSGKLRISTISDPDEILSKKVSVTPELAAIGEQSLSPPPPPFSDESAELNVGESPSPSKKKSSLPSLSTRKSSISSGTTQRSRKSQSREQEEVTDSREEGTPKLPRKKSHQTSASAATSSSSSSSRRRRRSLPRELAILDSVANTCDASDSDLSRRALRDSLASVFHATKNSSLSSFGNSSLDLMTTTSGKSGVGARPGLLRAFSATKTASSREVDSLTLADSSIPEHSVARLSIDNGESSLSLVDDMYELVYETRLQDRCGDRGTYSGTVSIKFGLPHGEGKMIYESGRVFNGMWKYGRWHGKGRLWNPNGDSYEGDFVEDSRHGSGVYRWSTGNVFTGDFREDLRHGQGTFEFANGNVYKGNFVSGDFEGFGSYDFGDGGRYVGQWKKGRFEGKGILHFEDGRVYTGGFLGGFAHGEGEEISAEGHMKKGVWDQGEFVR